MAEAQKLSIDRICKAAIAQEASDIHIVVGSKPMVRVRGQLRNLDTDPVDSSTALMLFRQAAMGEEGTENELSTKGMVDFATSLRIRPPSGEERVRIFRAHAFNELKGTALVMRLLPERAPTPEEIGMSPKLVDLSAKPQGLILITGATGSGKSTSLGALMNHISLNLGRAISTIEQPIEYQILTKDGRPSAVKQIEVPKHTHSFAGALRGILRQDPDVIMVGELRDYETIEVALHAAETGHLVLTTLHTNSAAESIDRLVDVFPGDKHEQIRTMLASCLLAVSSQVLVPTIDGNGRVMACELLLRHSSLPNLIRQAKTPKINDLLQTQKAAGMQSLDDHLAELVIAGTIDMQVAIQRARNEEALRARLKGMH